MTSQPIRAATTIPIALRPACGVEKEPASRPAAPPEATTPIAHAKPVNVDELDSIIRSKVRELKVIGLSVGVMQDGKIVLARGYGVRSLEPRDSVTPQTMFAVGSVTKQFTCGAVLLLAQEKKLSLEDHVAKYMPQLTRAG